MELTCSHILVEHRYEADDVLRLLIDGQAFSDLARRFSKCGSAKHGGHLGKIALGRLDETFAEAASILTAGEVSPVVRTRFGYHIILRH